MSAPPPEPQPVANLLAAVTAVAHWSKAVVWWVSFLGDTLLAVDPDDHPFMYALPLTSAGLTKTPTTYLERFS